MNKQLFKIRRRLARSFWLGTFLSITRWFINTPIFIYEYLVFKNKSLDRRFTIKYIDLYPCLFDRTKTTGFDPHYLYHPAWAARIIAQIKPLKHIDISSILHFSTILSAFVPVDFYDFRPAKVFLPNLSTKDGDILKLPFKTDSVESLSCMHTIEHIGLGRYGDTVDPKSDIRAATELERVVRPGGTLLLVTPITGKPRIEFNAHRIYSYNQVIDMFPKMTVKEFSLIPDNFQEHGIIKNASKEIADSQNWGCGCFWLVKNKDDNNLS